MTQALYSNPEATPVGVGSVGSAWWRQAVVYQVYPRSFADADGDGLGDLPGLTSRLLYLRELRVDAVWLSPFYPSALADGGYDVDDYRDVDPRLGTLADFDDLVAGLHELGMKMIVDIVPNHSSNRHPWFVEALAAPRDSPARARYLFRDGTGPDGSTPPTDWSSLFGGPIWERITEPDGTPGQWYLHLFAAEQPDLNWANPEVREDFLSTLRFWSDRGVDGFRVDAAPGLSKDLTQPMPDAPGAFTGHRVSDGSHPYWDRNEITDIYREWRQVLDEYTPPKIAVAEAGVHPTRRSRYSDPQTLGQAFSFDLMEANWAPGDFHRVVDHNLAEARRTGTPSTWVLSNHDVVRHRSRYALPLPADGSWQSGKDWLLTDGVDPVVDTAAGHRRARAAALLMLALPGSVYLYQGEELGLPEVGDLPAELLQDPSFVRSGGAEKGRDGCRVPLPWTTAGPSLGFGAGPAWLPQPPEFSGLSVEAQSGVAGSTLELYRAALAWRRQLRSEDDLAWVEDPEAAGVVHFRRSGGWESVTNFGSDPIALPPGELLLSSGPTTAGSVPPDTTVWLRGEGSPISRSRGH